MTYAEIWKTLSAIDVSGHIEKKNGLSYLSWAWAWGVLMEHYPQATYDFGKEDTMPDGTVMVYCKVTIGECQRMMWLPVMDHRNKAIVNPDAFARNTALMRCLVKCLAMYGLGHYIYAGEDLPPAEVERQASPITSEQHSELTVLISRLDGAIDMPAFLKFFKIAALTELKQSDFQKALTALKRKLEDVE